MITVEEIVATIKEILPSLKEVPVLYNNHEANCIGSAFFGLGKYCYDIMPEEEYDNPMFEVEDFVEQKHLPCYHVALPEDLLNHATKKDVTEQYFEHIWNEQNFMFPLNDLTKKLFIILHEFGHAHELYVKHNCNVDSYLSVRVCMSKPKCDTFEGMLAYKELEVEKYADNIVYEYMTPVFKKLIGIE